MRCLAFSNLILVLNIGTSSQLSIILNKNQVKDGLLSEYPALDIVPYLYDQVIVTAASLTGKYF